MDFAGKNIAVIGMARSGLAAADVLSLRGATVALHDAKSEAELADGLAFARERGIAAFAGSNRVGDETEIVVTSPGVRIDSPVLADARKRGLPIWSEIEAAYRISKAPILAITGTNGKTTTTALLGAMIKHSGRKTYVAGNIAAGPIALPLIRAAAEATENDAIVAEISSFQLESIDCFRPKVAAILNITADHLDRQTWDEYVASKWRIFENQVDGDTSVLRSNVPNPQGLGELKSNVVYFDQLERPDWIDDISLPGEHNKENVMAAVAMARAFGVDEDSIRAASLTFSGVVHRLEHVATINRVRWINNSMCTNNDAFARSLDAFAGPKIVIAGGVYKGGDASPIGEAVANESVKTVIWFGKSGRMLDETARNAGASDSRVVETIYQASRLAADLARAGYTVVLNPGCASFDQFNDFQDRGDQFKQIVREIEASFATEASLTHC